MRFSHTSKFIGILLVTISLIAVVTSQNPYYSLDQLGRTNNGFSGFLNLQQGSGPYGGDYSQLKFDLFYEAQDRLHIRIGDVSNQRWRVPSWFIQSNTPSNAPANLDYQVKLNQHPFGIEVTRTSTGEVLFNSTSLPFVFEDQYITFGTTFDQKQKAKDNNQVNIYGLGERARPFRYTPGTFTIWNLDNLNNYNENLYGTHPFYLQYFSNSGNAHGVFLLNSNAMDIVVTNDNLQWRTIGGVIDLYIFTGPTPDQVLASYHSLIGKPQLPAYFSMGWNHCRYGYKTLDEVKTVVQKYRENNIPLETIWNDIDYMDAYKDFTTDPVRYPLGQVKQFVSDLRSNKQHYVVIVDPGIKYEKGYYAYDYGKELNIFIKKSDGLTDITGDVWPGICTFPDFTNPKTTTYWTTLLKKFIDDVPVSGLWLDMNEQSSFCNGSCTQPVPIGMKRALQFNPNYPPYVPGFNQYRRQLDFKTLSMDAKYHIGMNYDVHALYALYQINVTDAVLKSITGKRPFILTRASYAGIGARTSKWLGDNESTWQSMKLSISGMLSMQLFGIPHIGADICGFLGNTTLELCARWTQLGAYYPFTRNHNDLKSIPQEPYLFGTQFIDMIRNVLANRYSLLNYYYTQFYRVHVNGGAVIKPLFFVFGKHDPSPALADIDTQFMVGNALMVIPVVQENVRTVTGYLPQHHAGWFNYFTGELVSAKGGVYKVFDAPLYTIANTLMIGGNIVQKQIPSYSTADTSRNPFELVVALCQKDWRAHGEVFVDDGESIDTIERGLYSHVTFVTKPLTSNSFLLTGVVDKNNYQNNLQLNTVTVYGLTFVKQGTCQIKVNGTPFTQYTIDTSKGVLRINSLGLRLVDNNDIQFECY
ncbi:hypothetical protein ABK040_015704 [Willaertia magna]